MPELPEIQTIVRGLQLIINKRISIIKIIESNLDGNYQLPYPNKFYLFRYK